MSDTSIESEIACSNRECRVAETGRCIEGLELSTCPHYGHPPELVEDLDELPEQAEGGLSLSSAHTLTLEQASRVLRARDGRVIAIVGPRAAGKTSLIAGLYDLLQEGAVNDAKYARSETLHAFELACHHARSTSRRVEPDMERTPHGEVRFFHLDVAGGPAAGGLALLLADRAGEEYRTAAHDPNSASFPEVIRADTITVLVDGERLTNISARHNLRSDILMILQALLDGSSLRGGQRLVLVLTKLDVVQTSPDRERAERDFTSICEQATRLFGEHFSLVESCAVAASPKIAGVRRGTGIDILLGLWSASALPQATERQVVGLLQLLREPPLDRGPRRLAIMLSAWDKVLHEGLEPEAYLHSKLPLLGQYLQCGTDKWTYRVYGLSAQGGEYDSAKEGAISSAEAEALRKLDQPSKRIRLVYVGSETNDLTEPLAWLME
jgi:hypothetical protein